MSLAAKHDAPAGFDLSGLNNLASFLGDPQQESAGAPMMVDLDLIDEDENNPRRDANPGFEVESIEELAESIKISGIKSPLSLRPNPEQPGRYIINHGHRRFRAGQVAGLTQVPAFLDSNHDDFDQVIENMQRENLTAREVADFIGGKLAEGMTQADIARRLGKSKAYVSQHAAMLNLPAPVAQAVATGQVQDVTLATELAKAHEADPAAVQALLEQADKPTRAQVKAIRGSKDMPGATEGLAAKPAPAEKRNKGETAGETAGKRLEDELAAVVRLFRFVLQPDSEKKPDARRVADFLLAWYDAKKYGGFDLMDLSVVDNAIALDMIEVMHLIRRAYHPTTMNKSMQDNFASLAGVWRPGELQHRMLNENDRDIECSE